MPFALETSPDAYRHLRLSVDGWLATLTLDVDPKGGLRSDYELKLNSYDLAVDIELADALNRIRFEHPAVKVVVLRSGQERVFCAGANIPMLAGSSHAFKVNFCKFTNETRLAMEDASARSGVKFLAAIEGPCAGGGYELAMACDHILLVDDGNSAVSLPEVPLLAVLPGTGGLTRLVDKRRVRRDVADVFCTTSEGVRGRRALEGGFVDELATKSRFEETLTARAEAIAAGATAAEAIAAGATAAGATAAGATAAGVKDARGPGIALTALAPERHDTKITYRYVTLELDEEKRTAQLTVRGPSKAPPKTAGEIQAAGADQWSLRAFRELDDALLRLRLMHEDIGVVLVRAVGDSALVLAADRGLATHQKHWLANEILALQARVLRRMDLTSKSFFALIDEGTAFGGSLLELALAADRIYMLLDDDDAVSVALSPANRGSHPMSHGLSRLEARFSGRPDALERVLRVEGPLPTEEANKLGLVTFAADDIDWEDDIRIAIEERASLSPDALTGMEASLRFPGPETADAKIFARLSAWQNWIFQRPNAVGPAGALTKYGQPERPSFHWKRC